MRIWPAYRIQITCASNCSHIPSLNMKLNKENVSATLNQQESSSWAHKPNGFMMLYHFMSKTTRELNTWKELPANTAFFSLKEHPKSHPSWHTCVKYSLNILRKWYHELRWICPKKISTRNNQWTLVDVQEKDNCMYKRMAAALDCKIL